MGNIAAYLAVIVVGAIVTLIANKPARAISLRVGYTALPDERKVHKSETPYGGGGAMLVGFCIALLFAFLIPSLRSVITSSHEMLGVLLATGVIFVVGLVAASATTPERWTSRPSAPRTPRWIGGSTGRTAKAITTWTTWRRRRAFG